MDFTQNLISYYKGERFEAILLTVFGFITLIISILIWQNYNQNQMLKGLFYPITFLAIFTFFAGSFGIYNNRQRLEKMPVQFAENRTAFIQSEIARFDGSNGVNKWWMPLKMTWTFLVVAGVALSFITKSEFINGVAIGLIVIGVMGFIIDGFAHQRAKIYTHVLVKQSES